MIRPRENLPMPRSAPKAVKRFLETGLLLIKRFPSLLIAIALMNLELQLKTPFSLQRFVHIVERRINRTGTA